MHVSKKARLTAIAFVAVLLGVSLLIVTMTRRDAAPFDGSNVVLGDKEFQKTSEAIVIPKNSRVTIKAPDDGNWDSIVSQTAGEGWRGVFVKGREVTLSPYCMARFPVTQELFTQVMGFNPSYFKKENLGVKYEYDGDGEIPELRPADTVAWFEAVVFCNLLTIKTMKPSDCAYYADRRRSNVYTLEDAKRETIPVFDGRKKGYRLPTEAEWEFAARGGDQSASAWRQAFSGTDSENNRIVYDTVWYSFRDANLDSYGWYRGNSRGITHEVGTKKPNALGLYDMSGGLWEWLYDWYDDKVYAGKETNPSGAETGTDRVLRGGSWYDDAFTCCVTRRFHNSHPYIPHFYFGFRYCRSL